MEDSDSVIDKRKFCRKCSALLELEDKEFESGEFTCPECGEVNIIDKDTKDIPEEVKAQLIDDSYAECIHCGTAKELSQNEIMEKSFRCPECRMENELEIITKFISPIYNENMVQCGNCRAELELDPEEILAKYFLCSECSTVNQIEETVNYAVFHTDTKEAKCIKCDRKLILEQDEIDRKYFFCPKCDTENFVK
jgi:predicted RNA-binding Zn-ribbon protein involved in translation (DUF1610 family)